MIGNFVTVQQLYDYAVQHNYLKADAYTVLDIIRREELYKNDVGCNINNVSIVSISPSEKSSTVDFSTLIEYTTEDLITLLST